MRTVPAHRASQPFRHEALFYAGEQDFAASVGAFIRDGAEAGEPTLVVVSARKIGLLREELNGHGASVQFADMADVGANPGRIIAAWQDFVDEHGGRGRSLRGVGEPIHPEREPAELVECHRHENLLNVAFAETPDFRLVCPYDTDALDPAVVEEARTTHPIVLHAGVDSPSESYGGLDRAAAPFRDPLPPPPPGVQPDELAYSLTSLRDARRLVAARATAAGLDLARTEDLLLGVSEVATNSIRYGGGHGVMRIWRDGDTLLCEFRDAGEITDPLVGRRRPVPAVHGGGFGLWLATQCCDLVQVRSVPGGTVVRLHMRISRTTSAWDR